MEEYMKSIERDCDKSLKQILPKDVDLNCEWDEFSLKDICDISATQTNEIFRFDKGDIPFVCASTINNGIQGFIKPKKDTEIQDGNCLTVSSLDGTSFYHDKKFVGRGHGCTNVLRYTEINKYNALFLATVIKNSATMFSYGKQLFLGELKKLKLHLPSYKNQPN
jgi:restriction endonuclease S subunit